MKKLILLLSISAIIVSMSSCNGEEKKDDSNSSQSVASSTDLSENQGSTELSGNQSSTQLPDVDLDKVNTEINKKRKNDDFESMKKLSLDLLNTYYDGIKKVDFDKCFSKYADFYKERLEKDMEKEKISSSDYMKDIQNYYKENFGEDFDILLTIDSILQLTDESLKNTNEIINSTFDKSIKLEDAYTINVIERVQGKLDMQKIELEWFLIKIDGEFYLYDGAYEQ